MEESSKKLKAHLFICTSCTYPLSNLTISSPEDASNLRRSVKKKCYERFGKENVKVSSVECLGECEKGIATVLYPSGEWNLMVRPLDEENLIEKVGKLIESL